MKSLMRLLHTPCNLAPIWKLNKPNVKAAALRELQHLPIPCPRMGRCFPGWPDVVQSVECNLSK